MSLLLRFVDDQKGATAIEYALIAAGIEVAIVAGVSGLGTAVKASYVAVSTAMK